MEDAALIPVGQRWYAVERKLGEGAYACVWAARAAGGADSNEEVAIKDMMCGQGPGILPDATLLRARFEVEVMQRLAADDEHESDAGAASAGVIRAPRVLDHQFWPLAPVGPEAYLCRVVMTRRRGQSMVSWLDARLARWRATQGVPASPAAAPPGDGAMDEVSLYCASFLNAASVARTMLVQLCPTFEKLNRGIAYHRDVNARNLLVYSPSDSDPGERMIGAAPLDATALDFSVVDFGSSISAASWVGNSAGSWEAENPTGDARYWGPASWLRFLWGAQALSQNAELLRQYMRRLDIFALAICTLELLAKLHTVEYPSLAALRSLPRHRGFEAVLVQNIQRVCVAWSAYWSLVLRSFDLLSEYSRQVCLGDLGATGEAWNNLLTSAIPESLTERLHELCADLTSLGKLCLSCSDLSCFQGGDSRWVGVGDTLEALCEMVHEGSALEWSELIARLGAPPGRAPEACGAPAAPPPGDDAGHGGFFAADPAAPGHSLAAPVPCVAGAPSCAEKVVTVEPQSVKRVILEGGAAPDAMGAAMMAASSPCRAGRAADRVSLQSLMWKLPPQQDARPPEDVLAGTPPASPWRQARDCQGAEEAPQQRLGGTATPPSGGPVVWTCEEREHEALRILRQVESEVRTLKSWYNEAIDSMRSPPFPVVGRAAGNCMPNPANRVPRPATELT